MAYQLYIVFLQQVGKRFQPLVQLFYLVIVYSIAAAAKIYAFADLRFLVLRLCRNGLPRREEV